MRKIWHTWVLPFSVLFVLGGLGAASLLLNVDATIARMSSDQLRAAGGAATIRLAILLQPILLTGVAALVGLATAERLGLRSLIVDKFRRGAWGGFGTVAAALRWGIVAGAIIVLGDVIFGQISPAAAEAVKAPERSWTVLLIQGVLYGGLTEEILMRWGLLSLTAWILSKLGAKVDRAKIIAVGVAALLFAIGHIPALMNVVEPDTALIVRTLLLNAGAGIVFGYAFLRHSLEAAMLAHGIAHVVIFFARIAGV